MSFKSLSPHPSKVPDFCNAKWQFTLFFDKMCSVSTIKKALFFVLHSVDTIFADKFAKIGCTRWV